MMMGDGGGRRRKDIGGWEEERRRAEGGGVRRWEGGKTIDTGSRKAVRKLYSRLHWTSQEGQAAGACD